MRILLLIELKGCRINHEEWAEIEIVAHTPQLARNSRHFLHLSILHHVPVRIEHICPCVLGYFHHSLNGIVAQSKWRCLRIKQQVLRRHVFRSLMECFGRSDVIHKKHRATFYLWQMLVECHQKDVCNALRILHLSHCETHRCLISIGYETIDPVFHTKIFIKKKSEKRRMKNVFYSVLSPTE